MRTNTALNHRDNARGRLSELYHMAGLTGMSQPELLSARADILKTISHCPMWVTQYLRGWIDARHSMFEQENLEFLYITTTGKRYSVNHEDPRYYTKHGIKPSAMTHMVRNGQASGHYCYKSNGKVYF